MSDDNKGSVDVHVDIPVKPLFHSNASKPLLWDVRLVVGIWVVGYLNMVEGGLGRLLGLSTILAGVFIWRAGKVYLKEVSRGEGSWSPPWMNSDWGSPWKPRSGGRTSVPVIRHSFVALYPFGSGEETYEEWQKKRRTAFWAAKTQFINPTYPPLILPPVLVPSLDPGVALTIKIRGSGLSWFAWLDSVNANVDWVEGVRRFISASQVHVFRIE